MEDTEFAQELAKRLTDLVKDNPAMARVVDDLIEHRVEVDADFDYEHLTCTETEEGGLEVGMLGILNALCRTSDAGRITGIYDTNEAKTVLVLKSFTVQPYKPKEHADE